MLGLTTFETRVLRADLMALHDDSVIARQAGKNKRCTTTNSSLKCNKPQTGATNRE